jgi:hypothetical protein
MFSFSTVATSLYLPVSTKCHGLLEGSEHRQIYIEARGSIIHFLHNCIKLMQMNLGIFGMNLEVILE